MDANGTPRPRLRLRLASLSKRLSSASAEIWRSAPADLIYFSGGIAIGSIRTSFSAVSVFLCGVAALLSAMVVLTIAAKVLERVARGVEAGARGDR